MSATRARDSLHPAYVLHHRPYRDTSRILDVFSRDHGRLTLFARGVRSGKSPLASVLQPFQPLWISWTGRGEAGALTRAEAMPQPPLPPAAVMSGYYLNELLIRLTTRHDPLPALFDAYDAALNEMRVATTPNRALRSFEKRLLDILGYGIDLTREARSGEPIDPAAYYHFSASLGCVAIDAPEETGASQAVRGASLIALALETELDERGLEDARRVLRVALEPLLEGRELATRSVARAVTIRRRHGAADSQAAKQRES
jgi:DNA repair protein RecO (recombination protein O)